MMLIADSGSTKCSWGFVENGVSLQVRTRGINAVLHAPDQVRSALAELPPMTESPEKVYFYGAGCGARFPAATESLREILAAYFGTELIYVESDLTGAARALFGDEAGIACILGTGSNSGLYDGKQIVRNVPPLGYVLGDEGGGAVLGRNLVNGIFKGHIHLQEEFLNELGLTYEEVIRRVYREPSANRFLASFVPFIREHLVCAEVREMVCSSFMEFVKRNLGSYPSGLPVAFVGGVAYHFSDLLREVMAECGYRAGRIAASPLEGLIEYHERR